MSEESKPACKPRLPQQLKDLAEFAIHRHLRRPATPELKITTEQGGAWWFGSPFAVEDEDHWVALMFDAFATRSQATFRTFMIQLSDLCSTEWNETDQAWHPAQDELIAAVQVVRSVRPRNEAEACLAAQMAAVHIMQLKLSAQALKHGRADPRSCAVAGKLARTFASQLETLAKLKGKTQRQRITVRKYSRHEHKHIHLHQGDSENGNQPHGPKGGRRNQNVPLVELAGSAPLQSPNEAGYLLPVASSEGTEQMPLTRRSQEIRCADGYEERCLQERQLDAGSDGTQSPGNAATQAPK